MLQATDFIVQDFGDGLVDGNRMGRGLIERDLNTHPIKMGKAFNPAELAIIPRDEWSERLKELTAKKMLLSDIRNRHEIVSLDQNGQGYCWVYGVGSAFMLARAAANMPFVRPSCHSLACRIKNFRDEGGWGALAVEEWEKVGCMSVDEWPEKSMSRQHNTRDNWARAEEFKITESWMDMDPSAWDRNMTFDQFVTLSLIHI